MDDQPKRKRSALAVALAIVLIVLLVIGWQFILPALGVAVAVTGAVWGVMIGSVAILAIGSLLFFVMTGVGVFILGLLMLIGAAIVVALFPILFPLLTPLVVLLLIIGYMVSRKR